MSSVSSSRLFDLTRRWVRGISPTLYRRISYLRNEGHYKRMTNDVQRLCESRVAGGPFAGMVYVNRAHGSVLAPKLIGSYEEELHPFLYRIKTHTYSRIIDIGAAEGYYAVGLARIMPGIPVVAFDTDAEAQATCRQLAALNSVADRVTVLGFCDRSALQEVLTDQALVICDCEGGEGDLLDPVQLSRLRTCDILVETHDFIRPGVSALLDERFRLSHAVEVVNMASRDPSRYPQISKLKERDRYLALNEIRVAGQQWLMMWANKTPNARQ